MVTAALVSLLVLAVELVFAAELLATARLLFAVFNGVVAVLLPHDIKTVASAIRTSKLNIRVFNSYLLCGEV
jgi:hypothetical protein